MSRVPRVAVVTGSVSHLVGAIVSARLMLSSAQNRGIGRAICELLTQDQASSPLVLYAVSRAGTAPALTSSNVDVRLARLSLTDASSVKSLVATIQAEHGGCDAIINNAGVYYYRENLTAQQRRDTLDTNYRGTLNLCQAFIPIMRPGGSIVNLSSQSGQMRYFSPELRQRFLAPDLTLAALSDLVAEYSVSAPTPFLPNSHANYHRRTQLQKATPSHADGPP